MRLLHVLRRSGSALALAPQTSSFARALSTARRATFFDMAHSNNAARIRLMLGLKPALREAVDTTTIAYEDLQSPAYPLLNPLKKVPALRRADGEPVFESDVIARFLLDKYGHLDAEGPSLVPASPEGRQAMNLLIRVHDLYIASPNTTAPGCSHTQGAMYLSNEWHGAARGMSNEARAAKLAEIWRQMHWLEVRRRRRRRRRGREECAVGCAPCVSCVITLYRC